MIAVTSGIAIGEHERLFVTVPHTFEALCVVIHFIEEGDKMHRMAFGATTSIVVPIRRVRDMSLMVSRVHILTIPTGRELVH